MKKASFRMTTHKGPVPISGYRVNPKGAIAADHGPWYVSRPTPEHLWTLTHGPSGYAAGSADTIATLLARAEKWSDHERQYIEAAPRLP